MKVAFGMLALVAFSLAMHGCEGDCMCDPAELPPEFWDSTGGSQQLGGSSMGGHAGAGVALGGVDGGQ